MLSWSSEEQGGPADLAAIADGKGDATIEWSDLLGRFASAAAGSDDEELAAARAALVAASDEAFMIDAAAVAANFEMMTRLADGTGARLPAEAVVSRSSVSETYGVANAVSQR